MGLDHMKYASIPIDLLPAALRGRRSVLQFPFPRTEYLHSSASLSGEVPGQCSGRAVLLQGVDVSGSRSKVEPKVTV